VPVMSADWRAKGEKLQTIGNVYFDKFFTQGKSCILLRIDDDGMDKSGIMKRDLALVERREVDGSEKEILVAAICEEGAIARTPRWINDRLHLLASNRSYGERIINPKEPFPEAVVVGVVITVIRVLSR
jgi:SOS-response transcriptional repressor LexA